ncbi:MAG: single-stranded DNA-binding protein [Bacteroidales bacterium]|nr:single-stranded DNA-binding protein [Bacteroidales bacterium]
MINKVILVGNVGQDPEVRYTGDATNGAKVASLRLATTERYRDRNGNLQEHTEWHSIVAWRNTADVIEKYVRKGTQLYIEGRLRTRSWDDQNGNKRYTTEIMADTLQLLGRKSDNPASMNPAAPQAAPQQYAPQQQTYSAPQQPQYSQPQPAAKPQNIVEDLPDDDLPF